MNLVIEQTNIIQLRNLLKHILSSLFKRIQTTGKVSGIQTHTLMISKQISYNHYSVSHPHVTPGLGYFKLGSTPNPNQANHTTQIQVIIQPGQAKAIIC